MIRLAVTGSIGSGKSVMLKAAQEAGYSVFDGDDSVGRLYASSPALVKEIDENFPGCVIDGTVNRSALGNYIYSGAPEAEHAATLLRRIVTPYVRDDMREFFKQTQARQEKIVVCEMPFLFESGLYREFDTSVNLAISDDIQRRRVLDRDKQKGMTEARLEKIKREFFSESARGILADITLNADLALPMLTKMFFNVIKTEETQLRGRPYDLRQRMPIVWLIGATSSGKSPIAEKGLGRLGFQHIMGSQFFRDSFGRMDTDYLQGKPFESYSAEEIAALKQDFVRDISKFSSDVLNDNPHINIDYVKARIRRAEAPCVLEGFRNPYEFMQIYDPAKDMVVFLDRENAPRYDTVFEQGIGAIKQNAQWSIDASLAPEGSVLKIIYGDAKIDVSCLAKGGKDHLIAAEAYDGAGDYELIDRLAELVPELAVTHFKARGIVLRPAAKPIARQQRPNP